MRAKFKVDYITVYDKQLSVVATPVCEDGIPENERFNKWTPSGKLEMSITNPSASGFFVPGKSYYLDFTVAPDRSGEKA